jgi:UrcA family protein
MVLAISLAAGALTTAGTACAEDGVWKVGEDYVIHFSHLDLDRPADRQALLRQVERAADKLCEGRQTRSRHQRCVSSAIASGLAQATPEVRTAVASARIERDGVRQAQN